MNSLEEYYVESLARYGGFAHKAIAAKVFHSSMSNVSYDHVREVTNLLRKRKVKVMDWRNMLSEEAKKAADITTSKRGKRRPRKKAG